MSGEYLELDSNPVTFEAVNQVNNVFFDDFNKQVFAVRSGGAMGVVVKGPTENDTPINFRMEDNGPLISIKFSLNRKILAVQRTPSSVEFMNFNGVNVEPEYSQQCKKNAKIQGFIWTQNNEVAFMTDQGIELYVIIPEKRTLKILKYVTVAIDWFISCPVNKIVLLASVHGSILQPIIFKAGLINKLPKLETEQSRKSRMTLERDVTLATLYGVSAVLILRLQGSSQTSEVHVHTLNGPGQTPVKSHVLRLGLTGKFAINVVDNLVIVHHQTSRTSMIFDVALPGESDGNVTYHYPVAPAHSLKPTTMIIPGYSQPQPCELYSTWWIVFQPNIVIDAKQGCMWSINLLLRELCMQIADFKTCTEVLMNRPNGKTVFLELLLINIKKEKRSLSKLKECFNIINKVYRDWIDYEMQTQTAFPVGVAVEIKQTNISPVVIDQMDIHNHILQKLDSEGLYNILEWVLITYISSLTEYSIPAQHNLNEILLTTLVRQNKFIVLQQLLQYGVVADTKPLACLLLSLQNIYPGASQLGLDMLTRLGALEEIQEVLLSENQILSALKFSNENVNPRKFLEAALNSDNSEIFHSIFYHFSVNYSLDTLVRKDHRLSEYGKKYKEIFNSVE